MIPRRNRGRPGGTNKTAARKKDIENIVDDKVSSEEFGDRVSINLDFFLQSDKEKFKLWKASMKISPEEVLIF